MSEIHRIRVQRLLIAGLLIVALLARLVPGERLVDDAYITFRYARNLVEGLGFVELTGYAGRPNRIRPYGPDSSAKKDV